MKSIILLLPFAFIEGCISTHAIESGRDHDNRRGRKLGKSNAGSKESFEGDITSACCQGKTVPCLRFELVGGSCSDSMNEQGDKASCSGSSSFATDQPTTITVNSDSTFESGTTSIQIGPGADLEFTLYRDDEKFPANTEIEVTQNGMAQSLEIHTSCSVPLGVGDQFGSLELVGYCVDPSGPHAEECKTPEPTPSPTEMPSLPPSMEPSSEPSHNPSSEPSLKPSMGPSSEPTYDPSSEPSLKPSMGPSPEPSFEPSLFPTQRPTSQPSVDPSTEPTQAPSSMPSEEPTAQPVIALPQGPLCECQKNPPDGFEKANIEKFIFEFHGGDCNDSQNGQNKEKLSCEDSNGGPSGVLTAKIEFFSKKKDPLSTDPDDGIVNVGGVISVFAPGLSAGVRNRELLETGEETFPSTRTLKKEPKFDSETFVHISSVDGLLLEEQKIHTSCSQGFENGDVYGALKLLGGDGSGACYNRL